MLVHSNFIYLTWIALDGIRFRSSSPEMFLGKGVLKTCSTFTGEHPLPNCDFKKVAT